MNRRELEPSDPRDLFRLLRRRGWILALCLIVIPTVVYVYTKTLSKTYESTVIVQPQEPADARTILGGGFGSEPANLAGVASIAETSGVAAQAARIAKEPIGSIEGVQAELDDDTGFITIDVPGPTPERARKNTRAVAEALGAAQRDEARDQILRAIASAQRQLDATSEPAERATLTDQLQQLETLRRAQTQELRVVEPAALGTLVAPHPTRNALLALIAAVLLGGGLMVLAERFDRRIRKPEELEEFSQLPLLGTIPNEAFPGSQPGPEVAEAIQTVRDSLTYFNVDGELSTLLVISPLKGDGKTTVATNLAVSLARAGRKVILVDADLRHPQVAVRLGVDGSSGLSEVLAGAPLADALREVPLLETEASANSLLVLPAGRVPPNPSELIGSSRMEGVLSELSDLADVVVIDTTPLLVVSDAFPLLDRVSGAVAIARLDSTTTDALRRMLTIASKAGGRVLGVVATGAVRDFGQGYGYGYGYGYDDKAADQGQETKPPSTNGSQASTTPGQDLPKASGPAT
jgi:capsular exopolysaccharide synthesis family protein